MSLWDMIRELRTGNPDSARVSRWLRYAGYACFLVAAWNAGFTYFGSDAVSELPVPPRFEAWLVILALSGVLFILAGRGVAQYDAQAVVWGQIAIMMLIGLMAAFLFWMFGLLDQVGFWGQDGPRGLLQYIWPIGCLLVSLQFFVPAFYALRYLQRLKGLLDENAAGGRLPSLASVQHVESGQERYCYSIFPFGVNLTFIATIFSGMMLMMVLTNFVEGLSMPLVFFPIFCIIFFGPILYNYFPSPFEKKRKVIDSVTGGGSILFLNGSWPFFRLLLYPDGIEIRFYLHAWFIPYSRLESVSLKRSLLFKALLICSDLPKVPSSIRFFSFSNNELLSQIEACKKGEF